MLHTTDKHFDTMLKYVFPPTVIILLMFFATGFTQTKREQHGFAVVELFTSEGCSSCPAADEAVIDIAKQYKSNVFIVGFHVDYWNHLGWKDAFSKADYSSRQKQYAEAFSLNSIYTPQIIVNGKTEFVGSDKNKLLQSIKNELSNSPEGEIELSAKQVNDGKIMVSYKTKILQNEIINIALVQLHAQNNISKGENEGKVLYHINIVRDFKSINDNKNDDNIFFTLPNGLTKKDLEVIAFTQDKKNMHVLDAVSANIQ